ncbi:MAG: transglutaminase domain-containing protein, partial [Eubacteriales bacterium]|nr:transglutaminase domain-containing protein [Eubacteriales bacterium]
MKKLAFFTSERINRLLISFLLCMGVLWPMLLALGVESQLLFASLLASAVLLLLIAQGTSKKACVIVWSAVSVIALIQFFLPRSGFFGQSYEAIKAISLYFNGVTSAAPLFATAIATLLAVVAALIAFSFSARGVGFVPATVLVVVVLFGLWSLGRHTFIWYAAPALIALLLLVSQSSHEKTNLLQVLPMAALLVLMGLLIVPSSKTVIQPLNEAAMNLKQAISDYLFFNEPRDVFTLGNYGYYPMGNSRLGGEAQPNEVPVLTVKTDQKTLLRGVMKDEYTGRSWRDTSSGRRYLYVNPRWSNLRQSVFLEKMPAESVQKASPLLAEKAVSIQVQSTVASTVFSPVFLRNITTYGSMVPYFNDSSELFITRDLEAGDRYTVFTPILEGGDSALGALVNAAQTSDPHYASIRESYLKLPDHLEQRVYTDLRNIVASASTPYDQACAILRHLQRYYHYTLSPDTPPENQDFVTYFLYVGREGYCTYFASAMTVLCRMAGLPARYVEGFLAQPDGSGFAYVTGKDAHAWTEVYFEGFGWVPFDPTPAQENVDNQQNDAQDEPSPSPSPEPPNEQQPDDNPTPSPENPEQSNEPDMEDPEPPEPPQDNPPFPWWILLVVAALGGLAARVMLSMPDRAAKKQKSIIDKLYVYGGAAYIIMKLQKRTPRSGETPLLFARRMDKQHAFAAPILPLWCLLIMSHYSRMQPGEPQL